MKVAIALLCVFLSFCLADHRQSSGLGWQGTWTEEKRGFGGEMYICVDPVNNYAWGSYSGAGLFSGSLKGTSFKGEWFEAGYDRPFGTFDLTLAGTTFSGSWSYSNGTSQAVDSFNWSGSRTSSAAPDRRTQCLTPYNGKPVTGTYENLEGFCYSDSQQYQNTGNNEITANFVNFGPVAGYSPDGGKSFFLSDYFYQLYEDPELFKPENNPATFGPCNGCNDPNDQHYYDEINTDRIVIGAAVSDAEFCAFFWEGWYNHRIGNGALCFTKTSDKEPTPTACGAGADFTPVRDLGNTELLLSEIQSVLDNIVLPPVVIVPGPFDGDDDDFSTEYFSQFITQIVDDDDGDDGDDDDGDDDDGNDDDGNDDDGNDDDGNDDDGNDDGNDDDDVVTNTFTTITNTFTTLTNTLTTGTTFTTIDFTSDFDTTSGSSVLVASLAFVIIAVLF